MSQAGQSALIGRAEELERLEATLLAAREGSPSLSLIAGEAGIGKTRLVGVTAARAGDRGMAVLWGDCVPLGEGELPYAPIVAMLEGLLRGPAAGLLEDAPGELRAALARLVPALAPGHAPADDPSEFAQGRLFQQLLDLFDLVAGEAGALCVVEDAHWADRATRDFLSFAVRHLRRERIALAVTYRTDELAGNHALRAVIADLARRPDVHQLLVGPLTRAELALQLEALGGEGATEELVEEIHRRSDGNPFYARELAAARLAGATERVPWTLNEALLVRVEQLSATATDLVRVLAVAGRPVAHEVLCAASGLSDRELAGALRDAARHHVVTADQAGAAYGFRHALVREAVYADTLPGERIALHRKLADALERLDAQLDPAELAHHRHAAHDAPAAFRASVAAGRAAMQVLAFEQALTQFERALSLLARQPHDGGGPDRVDLLAESAAAARLAGDYDRAVRACREALALVDEAAEPARAAVLHERLGESLFWDDEAALHEFEAAFALLPAHAQQDRGRLLARQGRSLMHLPRWTAARERCEQALELLGASAPAEEAYARCTLGVAVAFLGDPELGESHLRAALELAVAVGRPDDIVRAHLFLAEVLRLRGEIGAAHDQLVDGCAAAERLGMQASFGRFMSLNAAEDLLRLGRWDECEARLRVAARQQLRLASEVLRHAVAAQLEVRRGAFETAATHVSRAKQLCEEEVTPEYLPPVFSASAELALWEQRPHEARAEVARALELIGDRGDPLNTPPLYSLGLRAAADAAEAAAHPERDAARAACDAMLARLETLLARHPARRAPPAALGHRALCRAEMSRIAREPDPVLWRAAATSWDALCDPYAAAYARWREGEAVLATDGPRRAAETALRTAHVTAAGLGAKPLTDAIERLARAARLPVQEPEPAARPSSGGAAPDHGLSGRELEVLELVAKGLTNREIAERLFISDKTAGVHVSHILAKLNAGNRVMAAGMAHRLGLVDTSAETR